jgi:hypothetical protein
MSATLLAAEPVTCLSDPALRKRSSVKSRKAVQPGIGCAPGRGLLKVIAGAAASTYETCQLGLVMVFLAAALLGIATSFADLSRLLEQDAIMHLVEKAITASY